MHPVGVSEAFTGRVYPAGEVYEVSREKIREFAECTYGLGRVPAAHLDPEQARALGYPDVVAPPTFAVIAAQRSDARLITDPEAGIDFSRVVHGEESFVHHRPIVAGDRLVATLHVDSIRVVAGNGIITTRNEIATETGEPVSSVVSMLVVRGDG